MEIPSTTRETPLGALTQMHKPEPGSKQFHRVDFMYRAKVVCLDETLCYDMTLLMPDRSLLPHLLLNNDHVILQSTILLKQKRPRIIHAVAVIYYLKISRSIQKYKFWPKLRVQSTRSKSTKSSQPAPRHHSTHKTHTRQLPIAPTSASYAPTVSSYATNRSPAPPAPTTRIRAGHPTRSPPPPLSYNLPARCH